MVVLLVSDHIYHLVDGEVLIAEFGGAYVLSHIHRCAVCAEKELVVKSVACKVSPYRAVVFAIHYALLNSAEHKVFTLKICVRLIIDFVKAYAKTLVCLVKTFIHPSVHCLPERAHVIVAGLPLAKHLASLKHERRLSLRLLFCEPGVHQLFHFILKMLVEFHIEIADKVIPLLSCRLRS